MNKMHSRNMQRLLPLTVLAGRTTLVWVQRLGAGLSTRVLPL